MLIESLANPSSVFVSWEWLVLSYRERTKKHFNHKYQTKVTISLWNMFLPSLVHYIQCITKCLFINTNTHSWPKCVWDVLLPLVVKMTPSTASGICTANYYRAWIGRQVKIRTHFVLNLSFYLNVPVAACRLLEADKNKTAAAIIAVWMLLLQYSYRMTGVRWAVYVHLSDKAWACHAVIVITVDQQQAHQTCHF